MRILIVHNEYREPGGEEVVAETEAALLASNGHEVRRYTVDNDDISGLRDKFTTAWRAPYSPASRDRLAAEIAAFGPDIVHVHNFFLILTPSIYDACLDARVPVVQSLHNYRLLCPKGTMHRNGRPCEICLQGSPYHAVLYGCYRNSRLKSLVPARMVAVNRRRDTWGTKVTRYIAPSEFARRKFLEAGFPAAKIDVKPNQADPEAIPSTSARNERGGALFVARLSEEKGLRPLLEAWAGLDVPLRIVGDGPLEEIVARNNNPSIEHLGQIPLTEVYREMTRASYLIVPSIWYEGFPMVLPAAFACRLPAIVSRLGSLAEIVEDQATGLHVTQNDPADLAAKVRWAHAHPEEMRRMGENARAVYQRKYTPEAIYRQLMEIYDRALDGTPDKQAVTR